MWRSSPLWLRLMTSVLLLAAVALAISGYAGGRLLRNYLLDRTDERLRYAADRVQLQDLVGEDHTPNPYDFTVLDAEGTKVDFVEEGPRFGGSAPELPSLTLDQTKHREAEPFTVDSVDDEEADNGWRVLALPVEYCFPPSCDRALTPQEEWPEGTLVAATPLEDLDLTVAKLRGINFLVGLGVLGGLAAMGYVMIRTALRPLLQIEDAAVAIADGDMTRRAPDPDPNTEVGRVGWAFNTMLDQIETAFRDRAASETTARRSEARMRQFVGDASHELRTPLTSIRGFAELYRQGAVTDPEQVSDVLRRIESEAKRMGLLVDDLLLLARLDQERPLASQPVDLALLVQDAVEAARATDRDRPIELTSTVAKTVVLGDEHRLRQVVSNLLDNAVRHTPPESPVEVALARLQRDDQDWVQVSVRDHGPGLTSEQAERVFERFFRVDSGRPRSTGGSGLGLAIVAGVVAAHGGRAEVESAPGKGATFRVVLPAQVTSSS